MRLSTKLSGIVAVGGVAALGAGLISSGGIGADFSATATGTATLNTGTFDCQLSSTDTHVKISNNGHTATVDLGTITRSVASSKTAPLTVTSMGSIPVITGWSEVTTGNILGGSGVIEAIPAADPKRLAKDESQDVTIGFNWSTALDKSDLNRSGSAVYTVECSEPPESADGFVIYDWHNTSESSWDGTTLKLWIPEGAGGTGVTLIDPPNLSDFEPKLESDNWNPVHPASLRYSIDFADGTYVRGSTNLGYWTAVGGPTGHLSWTNVYDHYKSIDVTRVQVIMDNDWGGIPANIDCIDYSGSALFGSC